MSQCRSPMSQDDPRKKEAKRALLAGETIASIAQRLGVSRRTIERWADDGAWREQEKVVSINVKKVNTSDPIPKSEPAPRSRRQRGSGDIDELEIVDLAISDLSATLGGDVDPRALGGLAGGLCRLIELRRKLRPPTAAGLAEQVIALGISPTEFVAELKQQWQLRA